MVTVKVSCAGGSGKRSLLVCQAPREVTALLPVFAISSYLQSVSFTDLKVLKDNQENKNFK